MSAPTRPVLRWHGGKWILAPWIIEHFPRHRVYVEPFGGAGSVLMRKPRTYAEVWNDLDGDVVNLFRVLRSDDAGRLVDLLRLTPFAREEFTLSYDETADPVERATPAQDWINYPDALESVVKRLSGVVIENRDALQVMAAHDSAETLHYVDPPYLAATRDAGSDYAHELTDDDHSEMLVFLRGLAGMVVLSGYPDPSYDRALADWRRIEREALADGASKRIEVLWINPAAARALDAEAVQPCLFGPEAA